MDLNMDRGSEGPEDQELSTPTMASDSMRPEAVSQGITTPNGDQNGCRASGNQRTLPGCGRVAGLEPMLNLHQQETISRGSSSRPDWWGRDPRGRVARYCGQEGKVRRTHGDAADKRDDLLGATGEDLALPEQDRAAGGSDPAILSQRIHGTQAEGTGAIPARTNTRWDRAMHDHHGRSVPPIRVAEGRDAGNPGRRAGGCAPPVDHHMAACVWGRGGR